MLCGGGKSSQQEDIRTTEYETADYLDCPEAIEAYLEAAFETNDTALIAGHFLTLRKRGHEKDCRSIESPCRALIASGNPELDAILQVLSAVSVTLTPRLHANSRSANKSS